ncbi:MAG: hypothetical protein C4529_01625 [Deltaproteobacteria bacterium]|nr:MAG: hypothetical protein C4529_01625 [Deltaproteobacteria bacterium]
MIPKALPAAVLAALLLSACGPKAITVGSRPFASERALFVDISGRELAALPAAAEPVRLVMMDFPWCPACGDAWKSIREGTLAVPRGTVRIYRILFDREMLYFAGGTRESPPLSTSPPPGFEGPGGTGSSRVTTLTALPGAFRKEYRFTQGPVLLLLAADGTVARKWTGYSTSLTEELVSELRTRSPAPSPLPPGM